MEALKSEIEVVPPLPWPCSGKTSVGCEVTGPRIVLPPNENLASGFRREKTPWNVVRCNILNFTFIKKLARVSTHISDIDNHV